jgi:hypothetical protein
LAAQGNFIAMKTRQEVFAAYSGSAAGWKITKEV